MPCKYVIVNDGEVVLELWAGSMTLEELMAHKQQQMSDSAIKPGAAVLADCRRADVRIPPEAIGQLSEMEGGPRGKSAIGRYAFLVSEDAYDRALQFADQAAGHGKSVIVFNSLEVAAIWLGIDYETVLKHLESIGH